MCVMGWGETQQGQSSPLPWQRPCSAAQSSSPCKAAGTALLLLVHKSGSHKTVTGRSCSSCVSKAMRSLWTSCRTRAVLELLGCSHAPSCSGKGQPSRLLLTSHERAPCQCGSWAGLQLLQALLPHLGRLRAPEWECTWTPLSLSARCAWAVPIQSSGLHKNSRALLCQKASRQQYNLKNKFGFLLFSELRQTSLSFPAAKHR